MKKQGDKVAQPKPSGCCLSTECTAPSPCKKYKEDLRKAIRCAERGTAFHWPTIADILAAEIKRLTAEIKRLNNVHATKGCGLSSGLDEEGNILPWMLP